MDAPTVTGFVSIKTLGESTSEPSPHPLDAPKSLRQGNPEYVFANSNPTPVEKYA
jgi:hypothetical protein